MSKYQRRHYIGIARLLGSIEADQDVAESFADFLRADNPAFDYAKFAKEIDESWGKDWKMP